MSKKQESMSQCQVIGTPRLNTWDDYEKGCLASFGGGYRTQEDAEIFQHGMRTVFNLLRNEFPSAEQCKASPDLLAAIVDLRNAALNLRGEYMITGQVTDKSLEPMFAADDFAQAVIKKATV